LATANIPRSRLGDVRIVESYLSLVVGACVLQESFLLVNDAVAGLVGILVAAIDALLVLLSVERRLC
jgi:hypothetical protein